MKRSDILAVAAGALGAVSAAAIPGRSVAAAAANDDPRAIFREATSIRTADGIHRDEFVRIGGIDQWVSIRSQHKSNPILLFLHGGPGFTSIPTRYFYMRGWDEFFTVVQWDQRGAGKTYGANDSDVIAKTMTVERMTQDAIELAAWLRYEYAQQRIVLAAHSWGTVLGLRVALAKPQWLHAYVGMGQFISFAQSERLGYESTLRAARADRNVQAVGELETLAPFPRSFARIEPQETWTGAEVVRTVRRRCGGQS